MTLVPKARSVASSRVQNSYGKWTLWEVLRGKARVNISLDLEKRKIVM